MHPVVYNPMGIVRSPIVAPLRPEEMRGTQSQLVLEPRFAAAVAALKPEQHLLVVYHLHQAQMWDHRHMKELFTRRIACRPNPIGITLTQVVATAGTSITVVGLDAIDGTPILDIKPYKPIYDAPPVYPLERQP